MPEILTESFCERCGTRYTFESAAPAKVKKLGRFKTTAKGLKNYVMSDDTSLDEALAAARSDDEREQTSQQLDAFHATFNFCMQCRQYTCGNCWNEGDGLCLTCAPHMGHETVPAPFPEFPSAPVEIGLGAWPEADLPEVAALAAADSTNGSAPVAAEAFVSETVAAEAVVSETVGAEAEEFAEIDAAGRLDRLSATQEDVLPEWPSEAEAAALAAAEMHAVAEAVTEHDLQPEAESPFEPEIEPAATEIVPELTRRRVRRRTGRIVCRAFARPTGTGGRRGRRRRDVPLPPSPSQVQRTSRRSRSNPSQPRRPTKPPATIAPQRPHARPPRSS